MAGYADLLGPMLQLFGQDPEEQAQNIQALLGELRGSNSAVKASAGYTPMMVQMFQRMAQQRATPQQTPMMPRNFTPQMAQSLLRSIGGGY